MDYIAAIVIMIIPICTITAICLLLCEPTDHKDVEQEPEDESIYQSVSNQRLQHHLNEWRQQKDVHNEVHDENIPRSSPKTLRTWVRTICHMCQKNAKPVEAKQDVKDGLCVPVSCSIVKREECWLAVGPVDDTVDNTFSSNVYLGDAVESIEKAEGQEILL